MQKNLDLVVVLLPAGAVVFALYAAAAKQEEDFEEMASSLGSGNQGGELKRVFALGDRDFSVIFERARGDLLVKGPGRVRLSTRLALEMTFAVVRPSDGRALGFADVDVEFDRGVAARFLDDPALKAHLKGLFDLGAESVGLADGRLEVRWVGTRFRAPVDQARLSRAVHEFAALAAALQARRLPPADPPGREPWISDGLAAERRMGSLFGAGLGVIFGLLGAYGLPSLPFEPAARFRFAMRSLIVSVPLVAAAYFGLERAYLRRSPLSQFLVVPAWLAIGAAITAACLAAEAAILR